MYYAHLLHHFTYDFLLDKPAAGKYEELVKPVKKAFVSITKKLQLKETLPPGQRIKQEVSANIKTPNQGESASDALLREVCKDYKVSGEIDESIQKVFVTLNDQQEVVVVIDGTDGSVIQDLPSIRTSEEVVEHTVDGSAVGFGELVSKSPKKRGRKAINDDGYKFNCDTSYYTCKSCEKRYKSKQSMIIHLSQCQKNKPTEVTRGESKPKKIKTPRKKVKTAPLEEKFARFFTFDETKGQWTCKECSKSYKTKQAVMIHKSKCGNQLKKCMYCGYEGRNATIVRVHMMNNHNIIPRLNNDGTWIY